MANDNNDISDIVKKCKILLLDIEGTTTSISFVKVGLRLTGRCFVSTCVYVKPLFIQYNFFASLYCRLENIFDSTCKMVAFTDSQHGGRNQNGTPFQAPFIV